MSIQDKVAAKFARERVGAFVERQLHMKGGVPVLIAKVTVGGIEMGHMGKLLRMFKKAQKDGRQTIEQDMKKLGTKGKEINHFGEDAFITEGDMMFALVAYELDAPGAFPDEMKALGYKW